MTTTDRALVTSCRDAPPFPTLPGLPWRSLVRDGRVVVVPRGWPRPPHILEANPYRPDAESIAAAAAHACSHFADLHRALDALSCAVGDALRAPSAGTARSLRAAHAQARGALTRTQYP